MILEAKGNIEELKGDYEKAVANYHKN